MSNEIAIQETQTEMIEQKRTAWGKMGVIIFNKELALQAEAQNIILSIKTPATIQEVPEAENKLKEVKAAQKTIEGKRKEITSKFDEVTQRLMIAEKSLAQPIADLSASIIKIKKEYEAEEARKKAVADEAVKMREFYANEQSSVKASLETQVANYAARCYEKALKDDIEPDLLEAYINASKAAITKDKFKFSVSKYATTCGQNDDLNNQLFAEAQDINLEKYAGLFAKEIDFRFSDYATAFNNKAEALRKSREEEAAKKQEIEGKMHSEQLAAKLEAAATPAEVTPVLTKALKKAYEVDMPETVESAIKIMAAFVANMDVCLPKLKVTKWFSFNIGQAANVLGKVKSDDNHFQPAGITFKETDKL